MKSKTFENVCANYNLTAAEGGFNTRDLRKLANSKGINHTLLTRHQLLHILCGHGSNTDQPVLLPSDVYGPLLETPIIEMLIRNNRAGEGIPGLTAKVHNVLKLYYVAKDGSRIPSILWKLEHIAIVDYWLLNVDKYVVDYMMYGNPVHHAILEEYGRLPAVTLYDKPPHAQKAIIDTLDNTSLRIMFNRKYKYVIKPILVCGIYDILLTCFANLPYRGSIDKYGVIEGYEEASIAEGRWTITGSITTRPSLIVFNMKNGLLSGEYTHTIDGKIICRGQFARGTLDGIWTFVYDYSHSLIRLKSYTDTYTFSRGKARSSIRTEHHTETIIREEKYTDEGALKWIYEKRCGDSPYIYEWAHDFAGPGKTKGFFNKYINEQLLHAVVVDCQIISVFKNDWQRNVGYVWTFNNTMLVKTEEYDLSINVRVTDDEYDDDDYDDGFNPRECTSYRNIFNRWAQMLVFLPEATLRRMCVQSFMPEDRIDQLVADGRMLRRCKY